MDHTTKGRIDSKFRYVLLVAKRAEQLMQGAHPRLEGASALKEIGVAQQEIEGELIEWGYGEAEPAPTPAPVVEAPVEAEAPAEETAS